MSAQLMPQRSAVIGRIAVVAWKALRQQAARRLGDQRRQQTEQLLELRGLRGKSGTKVKRARTRRPIRPSSSAAPSACRR